MVRAAQWCGQLACSHLRLRLCRKCACAQPGLLGLALALALGALLLLVLVLVLLQVAREQLAGGVRLLGARHVALQQSQQLVQHLPQPTDSSTTARQHDNERHDRQPQRQRGTQAQLKGNPGENAGYANRDTLGYVKSI